MSALGASPCARWGVCQMRIVPNGSDLRLGNTIFDQIPSERLNARAQRCVSDFNCQSRGKTIGEV